MNAPEEGREVVSMSVESGTVALLNKSEIESQVDTAHKYPRSIKRFLDEASQMVTLNESIAQQCVYALLRWDGKKRQNSVIEGPSARFAEIVASAWGNCRAGARVVSEGQEFVTSQGVFHDLERNVAITFEVQRRITGSNGERYKADMIGVTANAASSIALRNAILKGVPKAFWESLYQKARAVVAGDLKTLSVKRAEAIKQFALFGVSEAQILEKLGRQGVADVTVDDLVVLFGLLTAIKDGDTTPEQAFTVEGDTAAAGPRKKSEAPKDAGKEADAKPSATSNGQAPAGDGSAPKPASAAQIKFIQTKAAAAEISEADIFKQFGIESLDGINISQVDEILQFIANPMGD